MDIGEAELIYKAGKEAVLKVLMEMDARTKALEQQILALQKLIASLSTNSTNSSKPPSSDGPKVDKPKKKKSSRSPGGRRGTKGTKGSCVQLRRWRTYMIIILMRAANAALPWTWEAARSQVGWARLFLTITHTCPHRYGPCFS